MAFLKIKQIGRVALTVLGILFILDVIRQVWQLYRQRAVLEAEEDSLYAGPIADDIPTILGVNERRYLFASYILSRVEKTTFGVDAAGLYVESLATDLAVPLEIRTAKMELNKAFPPTLARAVEEMLTGDVWTEAMEGPAARP